MKLITRQILVGLHAAFLGVFWPVWHSSWEGDVSWDDPLSDRQHHHQPLPSTNEVGKLGQRTEVTKNSTTENGILVTDASGSKKANMSMLCVSLDGNWPVKVSLGLISCQEAPQAKGLLENYHSLCDQDKPCYWQDKTSFQLILEGIENRRLSEVVKAVTCELAES